jgi:integrase
MLKWENVDLIHKALNVDPLKTRRYDQHLSIPIDTALEAVLQRAKSWDDETGYVCPKLAANYQRDVPCISADYTWLLKKAGIVTSIKKEGMKAQTLHSFHSLRHTFVSRLAEKGVSTLVIQSMTGHTTTAMTERYSHIGIDAKRKALGEESSVKKETDPTDESIAKKKLDAIKTLLGSKKNRTPLEEALLDLLE